MEFAVPLLKDLQAILGEEVVNRALEERNRRNLEAVESGARPDFSRMSAGAEMFAAGGALEYDVIAADGDHFDMNVTGCRYAEMMEELGGRTFGHLLLCSRDFAAARQLGMDLERSQTRMQGASHCDFRYRPRAAD